MIQVRVFNEVAHPNGGYYRYIYATAKFDSEDLAQRYIQHYEDRGYTTDKFII